MVNYITMPQGAKLPIIFQAGRVVVHVNPDFHMEHSPRNKWSLSVSWLNNEDNPAIIRLNNIKHAKRAAKAFNDYIEKEGLMMQYKQVRFSFKVFVTGYVVHHKLCAYISRGNADNRS